jgi:hypothetical protein
MSVATFQLAQIWGSSGDTFGIELFPLSVDLNSRNLFPKAKKNTGVISVSDSLSVSMTPYFASACEYYLLEEHQAVLSLPELHHLLTEMSPAQKRN